MMLLEGKKWEESYEVDGKLPDPSHYETDDEKELYIFLREIIPGNT